MNCVAEFEIRTLLLNKTHALIGGLGGKVCVLEQDTLDIIRLLDGHSYSITCIEYCSALNRVITASSDNTRVWNAATGGVRRAIVNGTAYVLTSKCHVEIDNFLFQ